MSVRKKGIAFQTGTATLRKLKGSFKEGVCVPVGFQELQGSGRGRGRVSEGSWGEVRSEKVELGWEGPWALVRRYRSWV